MANEEMDEDQEIEHASDDEQVSSGYDPNHDNSIAARRAKRRTIDDDYEEKVEVEGVEEEDSDEAPMDDLEPEHISDGEDSNKKKDKESKGWSRKHRTEVQDANLEGDEQEETVFIDNLPNDEIQIKAMLGQVAKHIAALEKRFFEEENSDYEEEEKQEQVQDPSQSPDAQLASESTQPVDKPTTPVQDSIVTSTVGQVKQFWCIPLSFNVKTEE